MALQNLVGAGLWFPVVGKGFQSGGIALASTFATIDADDEELQFIGRVRIDGGGSKTFGTSGSAIGWQPGGITFGASATVRVGVKKAASIDTSNGPPTRATIGAAAFDVYKDLVGGTVTITANTWRDDAMASGTPFTVTDGDQIAVCFHLDVVSGSQSIQIRPIGVSGAPPHVPVVTLVTSGPTYTVQNAAPTVILKFDDTTLGWIEGGWVFNGSAANTLGGDLGSTNIVGNIFRVPFPCKINGLVANVDNDGDADFTIGLYSTPLGSPVLVEEVSFDAHQVGNVAPQYAIATFLTARTLAINTDYAMAVKQSGANGIRLDYYTVSNAAYFKANGMGAECYGATSTAGGTFAADASGLRRYNIFARLSALDDGTGGGGGGGGLRLAGHGGLAA